MVADQNELVRKIYYGCLDLILEYSVPDESFWTPELQGKTLLLAAITPCATSGEDATQQVLTYNKTTAQIIIDLRTVQCVVGRVCSRGSWGIIDRSGDFARTEFISTHSMEQEEEGENSDNDEI